MNINVRFGAGLAIGSGIPRLTLTLPDGALVDDLLEVLRAQYPSNQLTAAIPVINGEIVSLTLPLADGQEVALLLPISGG